MKRNTTLFTLLGALVLGTLVSTLRPAAGQEPSYLADVRVVVDAYAAGLSSCDQAALAAYTTPPFLDRLRVRLSTCGQPGQLGAFRRVQQETTIEPDLVVVNLLWTQPDGVLELVPVAVKKEGGRWLVAGGAVP